MAVLRSLKPSRSADLSKADYYEQLGRAYQEQGDFNRSKLAYRKAHGLYARLRDSYGQMETALSLGDSERQLENLSSALHWYGRIRRLSSSRRHPKSHLWSEQTIDAYLGETLCYRALGRFKDTLVRFKNVLALYKNKGDEEGLAYSYWALGTTQRFMGHLREAPKTLKKSLRLYKRLKDDSGRAYVLCALGGTYRMKGDASFSGGYYRRAHRIFQKEKDQFGLAYALCGQGNALRMRGKYAEALRYLNRSLQIYSELGLDGPKGHVLWSRAQAKIIKGQRKEARADLVKAQALFRRVNDKRGLVYTDLGFGEHFRSAGRLARSRPYYRRALLQATKLGLRLEAVHAKRGLMISDPWKEYASLGVNLPSFKKYSTLP